MSTHIAQDHIVGESIWTYRIRQRVQQVAAYRSSVLITGPSGTGKELVARAIHNNGPRGDKAFVPVNCAAIPSGLFASQLFGHVKGAFTGAQHATLGCFRAADGGTIFLDEIGELDLDLQAKLLRVLQDREVTPVGSHESLPVDVRVVAATNRDLEEEVRQGRFRLDLFYRLNVVCVETVGLKQRIEDIPTLAKHFLAKTSIDNGLPLKTLSSEAITALQGYTWPGNVRELQNLIERAVLFTDGEFIGPDAFAEGMRPENERRNAGFDPHGDPFALQRPERHPEAATRFDGMSSSGDVTMPVNEATGKWATLAHVEREHVRRTLEETYYNQSAAARLLDIDRKLLARKIKKHQIPVPVGRRGRPKKQYAIPRM